MKPTKIIGNTATAKVLAALVACEIPVLLPFGDNERYDLLIELHGQFKRIQCKNGRLRGGAVCFATSSCAGGKHAKCYRGQADYFGVFCPETNECYLVDVNLCGRKAAALRVDAPRATRVHIRWANDFVLDRVFGLLQQLGDDVAKPEVLIEHTANLFEGA